jgi:glutamate/tyrosine decarboxylase-like PLP-dependent enzyme
MALPEQGIPRETLLAEMKERKARDANWRGARTFSLVFPAGDEVEEILHDACNLYLHENALNPLRFPSLREMEVDVVGDTADLLNAPEGSGGCLTSGGTESIVMAVYTARERARAERGVTEPVLVAPRTAHPAFAKAAKYLGLEHRQIPIDGDLRADLAEAESLIDGRTALVVGSAPNYPFGTVDPIPELAGLAAAHGISFHVDACVGGFLLPFWERLGEPVPPFDFRVDGVTTMSADVHKYGYCVKGASVLVHRDEDHLKKYQRFLYTDWPGGLYFSQAIAGTRPAPPIAAAWAVTRRLGIEGYLALTRRVREATQKIQAGIGRLPGLRLVGAPVASVFAFTSDSGDPFAIADQMEARGWGVDRQRDPDAMHVMISPRHADVVGEFLADLESAANTTSTRKSDEARYS